MLQKNVKMLGLAISVLLMLGVLSGCGGASKEASNIKIGVLNEMTGGNATYGNSTTNGAKLAIKEINAQGGVLGKQVQAVVADNKSEPSESASAMTKLATQDKVSAVTGIFASSNAIATSSVAESVKVPFVASGATNPKVTVDEKTGKVKEYSFRVCFIDPFQGMVAANFAYKNLNAKKAIILVDNSSDYSKGVAQYFQDAFIKNGGEVISQEAFLQKDQDFKAILTKVQGLQPDIIFVPAYYEEVGKIIKQARDIGITTTILGSDGWDSPKLVEIATPQALNNTFFTNHYSADSTEATSQAFVEAYKKEYNQTPDATAVLGYDGMKLILDAIKRANSVEPQKIKEALAQTKNFNSIIGPTALDQNHDAIKSVVIIEMKDGKQVYKETVKP